MSVLEVGVAVPRYEASPETGGELAEPFVFVLYRGKELLAASPVGIYRLPKAIGDRVRSSWPAEFIGPLAAARSWELLTPTNKHVAGRPQDFPKLHGGSRPDTMNVTVTLTGERRAT